MKTVKAITGFGAAEKFYEKLGGAIRYILPAATALAFMGLSTDAGAQTLSTDITLTNLTINENEAIGTAVGFINAVDADLESHTFTLVPGVGDDDNASFDILANKLQSAEEFNFEVKSSYSVRIAATGDDGLTYEKPFTISIGDVNDLPAISSFFRNVIHGQTLSIELAMFEGAYADEDGHSLDKVQINSLPSHGLLSLSGTPVVAGDIIAAADCDNLTYEAPDTVVGFVTILWNGEDGSEYAVADKEFTIRVTKPRTGFTTDTVRGSSLPSIAGFTIIGSRPSSTADSLRFVSTPVPGGSRPTSIIAIDSTRYGGAPKMGDEAMGLGANEQLNLNINAFPNPFASAAEIRFTLPEAATVEVNVYNYMGALVKQVVNGVHPAGVNSVSVGGDLSSGSYIYTVRVTSTDGQPAIHSTGSLIKIK